MRSVYYMLVDAGYRVALAAPTGKAAKRIYEATGIRAMTNHRLLEYPHPGERDPKTGKALVTTVPKRHKFNPLLYDVILIDEYRMVNWEVHRNLLDALPRAGCIRMFGDVNQLPPIERTAALRDAPSPFEEMLQQFNGVVLTTIHRQAEGSDIVVNADRILKGQIPRRLDDFALLFTDNPLEKLRAYVLDARADGVDFSTIDHQIITPTKKTVVGTVKLNAMLQFVFRPETDGWIELPRHTWAQDKHTRIRVDDKVIWTENDYNLPWLDHDYTPIVDEHGSQVCGIFNGETGTICRVDTELELFYIDVGDRIIEVPPIVTYEDARGNLKQYDPRKSVDLAYAITTHKAQGSEYNTIVYMLNKACLFMQSRSNFYTGVTRARNHVTVISDQRSISATVWKTQQGFRR